KSAHFGGLTFPTTTTSTTTTTTTFPTTTSSTTTTTTTLPSAPCVNGAVATKPKLTAGKLLPPQGDDKLSLSGEAVIPLSPPLDPPGRGIRLLMTGATSASLLDVTIPPGAYDALSKTGWKSNGADTSWTYEGPGTVTAGIQKVSVKRDAAVPGGIKF